MERSTETMDVSQPNPVRKLVAEGIFEPKPPNPSSLKPQHKGLVFAIPKIKVRATFEVKRNA
jgi:hypothetical protein